MKRKNNTMLKAVALTLTLATLVTVLVGCVGGGVKKDDFVGKWYYTEDDRITIRSDGTWKADDAYGSGTWKFIDDETVELTDFYGSTKEITMDEDENGVYITYRQKSYKDKYPESELDEDDNGDNTTKPSGTAKPNGDSTVPSQTTGSEDSEKIKIEPFEGIQYTVSGVSPYCKVSVNNAGCSDDAQMYVEYTFDKEQYKNGDIAIVTAVFSQNKYEDVYTLSSITSEYKIENQPEFITSTDSIDLTFLKQELDDYIASEIAKAKEADSQGWMYVYLFENDIAGMESIDSVTYLDSYLSVKKATKVYSTEGYYNILSFTLKIEYTKNNETIIFYPCISAVNVIKDTDGSIRWGSDGSDNLSFISTSNKTSLEECVEIEIMKNRVDYNISKIEK